MAITALLVFQGRNHLRYLIVASAPADQIIIEGDGGVTPDLLTDSITGPIRTIMNAKATGYGIIPPSGINTDAEARALLLSDNAASLVGPRPTLIARITPRTTTSRFTVNAGRGPSDAATCSYVVTAIAAGECYLDIECPGAIGA